MNTVLLIPDGLDPFDLNGFSIEPEIDVDFFYDKIKPLDLQDRLSHFDCSARIHEIDNLHELPKATRKKIYEVIRKEYAQCLPIGGDNYLSGGVHFHIFGGAQDYVHSLTPEQRKKVFFNLVNTPLMIKKQTGQPTVLQRPSRGWFGSYDDSDNRIIHSGTKSNALCFNGVGSIEFRLNGVFDGRLIGYYLACLLMVDRRFRRSRKELREYIFDGDDTKYYDQGHISFADSQCTFDLTEDDAKKIKTNTISMLNFLTCNGYPIYAQRLQEYCKEYGWL